MHEIPALFAQRIVEVYGTDGWAWLDRLPSLLADCAERWSLTILPPFTPLSYNYAAPAIRADGVEVVIKVGVPNPELYREMAALQLYDGQGIAQLLDADVALGVLLLERLKPGTLLVQLEDDREATSIAAHVMRQLWRPVPLDHSFHPVAAWAAGLQSLRARFGGTTGPFSVRLVEMAEGLFNELLSSMEQQVLLHGDLHHFNILAAERQPWLAIDPKGVVGEAAYEVGTWLRNPMPQLLNTPYPHRILARRVDQLAEELGFDRTRLLSWAFAQAVLSAWWTFEDHGHGWEPGIALAEQMAMLL